MRRTATTAADALRRAADVIERHGWCRGEFQDDQGRVCLELALLRAGGREPARRVVEDELARRGRPGCHLVDWNDVYAAGEPEVLDVLRAAADRAAQDRATRAPAGGVGRR